MPIRVTCACGHAMNVPDAYAGKTGKCPKCSQSIKIPAGNSAPAKPTSVPAAGGSAVAPVKGASAKSATSSSKAGASSKPTAKPATGGLDQLFSEAGLDKKSGPVCPACQAPVKPGSVLCTACGFHLESGQKLQGHTLAAAESSGPFSNKTLNAADQSLKKEYEADEAIKFVGWPWWVYLAFVFGLMMAISFGVMRQDQERDDNGQVIMAPAETLSGQIQRMPFLLAMSTIGCAIASMVAWMASIAVLVGAFQKKAVSGLLCLFVPLYIYYFAFKNRKTLGKGASILLTWTGISMALGVLVIYLTATRVILDDQGNPISRRPVPWLQSNERQLSLGQVFPGLAPASRHTMN